MKQETTENFVVFDKIKAEDMEQGRIGNCYLLAVCGAIVEYPH